jgi:hypothetical protein
MVVPSDECVGSSYAFSGNIQRGNHAEKASTGWTDATICLSDAQKLLKCPRVFSESSREFHKLSNKYKITQSVVQSKELWPKYRRAATCVIGWTSGTVDATSIFQRSKIGQMLRIFSESCVEFHKISNKYKIVMEFRAKRYMQNSEGHTAAQDDLTLHKMTPSVHPMVYLN